MFAHDHTDDSDTTYAYFCAKGRSIRDCAVIGHRYDVHYGFTWSESESWVIRYRPAEPDRSLASIEMGGTEWLTRLWLSPSGRCWVAGGEGHVHVETPEGWRHHDFEVGLSGLWGLNDEWVLAWSEERERMFLWDGRAWGDFPCPGRVVSVEGPSPDQVVAGCYDGQLWRWDGTRWDLVPVHATGTFAGVHAVGEDRVYACSHHGELVEISPYGAQLVLKRPIALLDVQWWDGALWLAAGLDGLFRLVPGKNELELVAQGYMFESFARSDEHLLISADQGIIQWTGDEELEELTTELLFDRRRGQPPAWLRRP